MAVNRNDMYVYLESAQQLEAAVILDAGMFIKQIGGISRALADKELDENCHITGIDVQEEYSFPIYNTVYDKITSIKDYIIELQGENYDLGIMLGSINIDDEQLQQLVDFMSERCRYMVSSVKFVPMVRKAVKVNRLTVDEDTYALFKF